jgi:uncharacterized membrane protein
VWPLFFLICLGLGYPTLNRYDPRTLQGLSDTALYYQLVAGPTRAVGRDYMQRRVLVPIVAKPFYWFARSHVGNWDPVFFGLLIANSLFCATAACLLVVIAYRIVNDSATALLSGTLYLLSFAIPNLQLAGLIDSAESCLLLAVTWSLFTERWWLLPVWGVIGALAKETFVPFSLVFVACWWLAQMRESPARRTPAAWWIGLAVASIATLVVLHTMMAGYVIWPWMIAQQAHANVNLPAALWRSISDHGFWYVFGWLLPLGVWRLRQLPRPWVVASVATGVVALLFGAWKDMLGTAARPLFDVMGPVLCVSVALLLTNRSLAETHSVQTDDVSV